MSRSALWRQEGNVKERERQADAAFLAAVEQGRNTRTKGLLPLWGPDDSFHFNPMLLQKIIQSNAFQKACRDLQDWNALVDAIYYQVSHVEPWALGGSKEPSPAFVLLLRLLLLRCSEKQMSLLLNHPDSPYIQAVGFLYLRYAGDPKTMWKWIQPHLYKDDDEPFAVTAKSTNRNNTMTMGAYVRMLFSPSNNNNNNNNNNYYGTMLPRLPVAMERELHVHLLQAEKIEQRAQRHCRNQATMNYLQRGVGKEVMALYGDDDNPITWYEGVIDQVNLPGSNGAADGDVPPRHPSFVVTFPEYGNTETVSLGEVELKNGGPLDPVITEPPPPGRNNNDHRATAPRNNRGGYHDRTDRNDSRWQGGYSNSDRGGHHDRCRHREGDRERYNDRRGGDRHRDGRSFHDQRGGGASRESRGGQEQQRQGNNSSSRDSNAGAAVAPVAPVAPKRSAEELAAIREKKRKLMAKYG